VPLALAATAIVLLALLWQLALPRVRHALVRLHTPPPDPEGIDLDPGRELRAEQRARRLLRSCVNEEEWAIYRELGFLRVWGASHAYLIYPHLPIVAYLPQTGRLLGEYCVAFPNHAGPGPGAPRLPDADDVLAKWLLLSADEQNLIAGANMHLPGRQIPVARLSEDLARLARWERERLGRPPHGGHPLHGADSVPAS
jgi:hypothetical protein